MGAAHMMTLAEPVDARARRRQLITLLEAIGAGAVRHSHATLLDHLVGVAEILERWGAEEDVIRVGLFHSVYGTEIFQRATVGVDERPRIRGAIGERAERLAFLFCTLERSSIHRAARSGAPYLVRDRRGAEVALAHEDVAALINVLWANELEQRDRLRNSAPAREREARALAQDRGWLSAAAIAELERDLGLVAPIESGPAPSDKPWLKRLLNLEEAGQFLREGWAERFFLARGPVDRLDGLCDYDFDALCRMKTSYTRAFFKTQSGEVKSFDLRPGQERTLYEAGATIYFHGLDGPRIQPWVSEMDGELGLVRGLTRVSAFASLAGKGLTPHYDLNDNFVCQARGKKRWRIAANTHARNPLYGFTIGRPVTPVHRVEAPAGLPTAMPEDFQTVEMEAGMVMFVPRGMWHDTETTDEASLHFNIQSGLPTWRDLLDFVVSRTPLTCAADLRAPALDLFEQGTMTAEGGRALEGKLVQLLEALRSGELRVLAEEFHRYAVLRRTRLFEYPY